MAQNLNQILWGEGVVFVDNKEAFDVQEVTLTIGMETMEALKGDGGGSIVEPTAQPISGRINFLGLNSSLLATLTGGSVSSGTKKRIRSEQLTVSSNAVTTSQTPIANTLRVVEVGSNKIPLKQVSGSPSANDEYSVSGTTITFNTGAFSNGTIISVSYFYDDNADGETLSIDPGDLPDNFELYASLRTRELFGGTKGDIIVKAAKCQRTSEMTMGASIGNISTPGFDFNVRIDAAGDFQIYFP
jgi:hypothetical protein